ncbi:MAG TPA: exopolysaccharide biosynthesis polyprenyl glycosylphosphotransferase [Thermoleophilaceae bacterium]|nr:exopolysaccharide biosynthesis polyprenyl glycosylphosphotransferase [Thermoleophilaceae bacterium]
MTAELYGLYERPANGLRGRGADELPRLATWAVTSTLGHVLLLSVLGIAEASVSDGLRLWALVVVAAPGLRWAVRAAYTRAAGVEEQAQESARWRSRAAAAAALTDAVTLCAAVSLGLAGPLAHEHAARLDFAPLLFVVVSLAVLRGTGAYGEPLHIGNLDDVGKTVKTIALAAMVTLGLLSLLEGPAHLGAVVLRPWLIATLLVPAGRVAIGSLERRAARGGELCEPTLLVGVGETQQELCRRLAAQPFAGLRPVGFVLADGEDVPRELPLPVVGSLDGLANAIQASGATHVVVGLRSAGASDLDGMVRQCSALGIGVSVAPGIRRSVNRRLVVQPLGDLSLFRLSSVQSLRFSLGVKHAIDRLVAGILLVLLSPLLLAIAAAVKLSSRGPVLIRQIRVGRDGRPFGLLKFRSMRIDLLHPQGVYTPADGVAPGGVEGEDRRTRLGRLLRRTSLDELPQLLNVLKGEMSLVGPRPERPEYVSMFRQSVHAYDDRLRVKAGITGWAQVHGLRGQTSLAERLDYDNYYIENWSHWLDLKIAAMTLPALLRFRE